MSRMRARAGIASLSLATALALAGVAGAALRGATIDRGIVQSVSQTQIVLRELDGRQVTLAVGPGTRVRVNGSAASVADVLPGFVAAVVHDGATPARTIRAFGLVRRLGDRGVVAAVTRRTLTIRTPAGALLTFRRGLRTRVRRHGLPAGWAAIRPGTIADVTHTRLGVALLVLLRPGGTI